MEIQYVNDNYATLCRLCLERDGFMLSIFDDKNWLQRGYQGNKDRIHQKILDFLQIQVHSNDGLPSNICHRCLYKIELCLDFKKICLQSDATLRGHESPSSSPPPIPRIINHSNLNLNYPDVKFDNEQIEDVVTVVDPTIEYDADPDEELNDNENSDYENEDASHNMLDVSELKNVFMCRYCDKAFILENDCAVHEQTLHDVDTPFLCHECDMAFGDRVNYTAHLKSVHKNDKPFGCPECDRAFGRRSDLRKHTIVHTGIKPFTCHICYKSFSRNTNLNKHLRIHSGHKPHVCPNCPRTFISKGDLSRHVLIHSGVKPFSCNHCHQSFGRRDKLLRHEKKHIKPENPDGQYIHTELSNYVQEDLAALQESLPNREIKEEVDSDQYDNSENMVISLNPYTDDRPGLSQEDQKPEHVTGDDGFPGFSPDETHNAKKQCSLCPQTFPSEDLLKLHEFSHRSQIEYRPHVCPVCRKSFMRKRELDRHIAIHTGIKPFACTLCPKKFGRKDKLVRHMRVHDPNKNVQCSLCPMKFTRREDLIMHMRVHSIDGETIMTHWFSPSAQSN